MWELRDSVGTRRKNGLLELVCNIARLQRMWGALVGDMLTSRRNALWPASWRLELRVWRLVSKWLWSIMRRARR